MALNDDATLVIGSGNYLIAEVGTAIPADLTNPATPWDNIGHTSLEDIMSISSDGGDATVLGTLQTAMTADLIPAQDQNIVVGGLLLASVIVPNLGDMYRRARARLRAVAARRQAAAVTQEEAT